MKKIVIILGAISIITIASLGIQIYKDKQTISKLNKELSYKTGKISSLEKEVDRVTVPLRQYVEDIDFMESVILELRNKCEGNS